MIHVEVKQGVVGPYKNTNLCREVLSMWLPPTQAGGQVLGNTFIDGAHMVLAGTARGQLRLLYKNSEVNPFLPTTHKNFGEEIQKMALVRLTPL